MDDLLDGELGNRILSRELHSRDALGESFTNLSDLLLCELGLRAVGTPAVLSVLAKLSAQDASCVQSVFAVRHDFKVIDSVVILDPILMVDDSVSGDGANEHLVNEPMDLVGLHVRCSGIDAEDVVSIFVDTSSDHPSSSTDYPALVGNEVAGAIRDFSPFFDLFHTGEDTTGFSRMARAIH